MAILAGGENTQQKLIPHCVIESAHDTHQYDHLNRLNLEPGFSYPEGDFSNLDNDLPITIY